MNVILDHLGQFRHGAVVTIELTLLSYALAFVIGLLAWAAWFLFLLTRLYWLIPVPGQPEAPREFPRLRRWD